MNYHLQHEGQDLGIFPLYELRQRRATGKLTGAELVWCEGMTDWQPLDSVLQTPPAANLRPAPPPVPKPASRWSLPPKIAFMVVVAFLVVVAGAAIFTVRFVQAVRQVRSGFESSSRRGNNRFDSRGDVSIASKPVSWSTNTLTEADVQKSRREFRLRQWLEGYKLRGERNPSCDAQALGLIGNWIASNYGGPMDTNLPPIAKLCDKLAADPACTDPLVLAVAGMESVEPFESIRRLERAVRGFENSRHKAYPKFCATVTLAGKLGDNRQRRKALDASALQLLAEAFKDGSLLPEDQAEIADILVNGWASSFFDRSGAAIRSLPQSGGESFQWLSLVLEGEYQINEAWKARGGGYEDKVTETGWQGFRDHLAQARTALTKAWKLQPDLPLAPCRMIYVSLGDSDIEEMRLWFDRTVAAQIDCPRAWSDLRWGLRPRWYGSHESMLALGVTALNTRRFDTDVPRKFFDSVSDLESELKPPLGRHIYGREDIWPHLQEMYEGYIAATTRTNGQDGWRSTYSAVAYLAGKYDVARTQLEALNWKPWPGNLNNWGTDLSLMPLEVAARTSPLGPQIAVAESNRNDGEFAAALQIYSRLPTSTSADERARSFVQDRMVTLELERRLQGGLWIDFLPSDENFTGWHRDRGTFRRLRDGALEVQADQGGHIIYSRARVGMNFEVKGSFEVVRSSNGAFQAGLVMGIPEFDFRGWYSFRLKRNPDEGEVAAFSSHWARSSADKPVTLNSDTNAFYFRFQGGKVIASVNGQDILTEIRPPKNNYIATNEFMVGFGAFNDMNDTVIRYRNVQIRKLP